MAELVVKELRKSYNQNVVLSGVDFSVESGKFLSLLGPSGCGKSTILKIIAGLVQPDSGDVVIDGKNITSLRPEKRNIGLVFQNYALFPAMDVAKNVGYGLKMRKVDSKEIDRRVDEALELVKLPGYGKRKITQLSGGEQQRIALARALVIKPEILLLDEPLSALDRKIRAEMQYEIRNIQREVGITTVFVTHDQEEALTMSDEIILLHDGNIEQRGTPLDIYSRPASVFASDFMGKANLLEGTLQQQGEEWFVAGDGWQIAVEYIGGNVGDPVKVAARGEYFEFCQPNEPGANEYHLDKMIFTGLSWKIIGRLGNTPLELMALGKHAEKLQLGTTAYVRITPDSVVYYNQG